MSESALIVVDVQNDFCSGGSLAVPGADKIVPYINMQIGKARLEQHPIFFSRDWHPAKTGHFKEFGGIWPSHCVRDTHGAKFHPVLDNRIGKFITKGSNPDRDDFSAFDGHVEEPSWGAPLHEVLKGLNIKHLTIVGLATDYCVKATVLDALKLGYRVTVPKLCIAAVNVNPMDGQSALLEMSRAGAFII